MTRNQYIILGLLVVAVLFCFFMGIREKSKQPEERVVDRITNWDLPTLDKILVQTMQDNANCVWAEARGVKNDPYSFEIVCHRSARK